MDIKNAEKLVNLVQQKKRIEMELYWLKKSKSNELSVQLGFQKKPSCQFDNPRYCVPIPEPLPCFTFCYETATEEHKMVLRKLLISELENKLNVINMQIEALK